MHADDDVEDDGSISDSLKNSTLEKKQSSVDFSSIMGDGSDPPPNRKGKKKKEKERKADLYALLGLQHERWMASEADIRTAYRKAALEHHPDKKRAQSAGDLRKLQENEEKFKAIQDAYETLCDPGKRREFDSLDPFDDSLPTELQASDPEEYFLHFGAAFKRNSKWSMKQPVPELGSMESDDENVDAFYTFWFSFKSWREFPHPDEEDVELAEGRDERRWIERHNAKLREKGRKDEIRRINEFVDLAHRLDPRIIQRKEAERLEKERQKAEKAAERQRKLEEENARKELEEKIRQEEENAKQDARKQRQMEKKALQKERSRLRKCTGVQDSEDIQATVSYPADNVEIICAHLSISKIQDLNSTLRSDAGEEDKMRALEEAFEHALLLKDDQKKEKTVAMESAILASKREEKEALQQRIKKLEEWNDEEVRLLNKALDKFPPGTSRRWETIQGYLRTRTEDEIIDMVKYGLKSGRFTAPSNDVVITEKKKAKLQGQSAATLREESFTDVAVTVSKDDASKWSKEEDTKLVKALKEYPKTVDDRWDKVAAAVGGSRTKVECAIRFKEMKQAVKMSKK